MEEKTIIVRDAREADIPALAALEKECFSLPWTEEQLRASLPGERSVLLAAEGAGKVLGYVGMMHVLDEGYLSNVAVDPACRRQGVAKALIAELLRRAGEFSLAFVTLEVRESNTPAIALYEGFGFAPVGRRKNYYDAPKEDAVLMTVYLK